MSIRFRHSIRLLGGDIQRHVQFRNANVARLAVRTHKRPSSSFKYEKPAWDGSIPEKKGFPIWEGAFIFLGGIGIGWRTRQTYMKHKYGGEGSSSSSMEEEEEGDYTGLDWMDHPVLPSLDLEAASKKLLASQKTYEFSPTSGNVRRLDTIRFGSNSPIEDQLAHESVDVGLGEDKKWDFWGVYDGHAGWETSKVLKQSLIAWVAHALETSPSDSDIVKTIKSAFLSLDNAILASAGNALSSSSTLSAPEILSRLAPASAGSCALLAIHDPSTSTLHIANTGDSRAVLGRLNRSSSGDPEWIAEPLSLDQTGFNPSEIARIATEHPGEKSVIDPLTGRVLGIMISRAFGDVRWKWPLDLLQSAKDNYWDKSPLSNYKSPPYLTAEPEVTTTTVQAGDFLILATDGLWDHISSQDAVKAVELWIKGQQNPQAMWILNSLESIGDEGKKGEDNRSLPGANEDWRATEEYFTLREGDNAAAHLARQSLGGNRSVLFRSVVGLRAPSSRKVRDDITVQVVFFADVVGGV